MPALAGLGDVLFALLCLGIGASIITIGKFIAALIPSVPIIGNAIHNAIISASQAAGDFLVNLAHGSFNRISALFQWMVAAQIWPIRAIISVFNHHATQISHLHNTDVPDAINSANSHANTVVNTETTRAENREADLSQSITDNANNLQANITKLQNVTVPNLITAAKNEVYANLAQDVTSLQNNINSLAQQTTALLASVWAAIQPLQNAVFSTIPAELAAQAGKEAADNASTRAADAAALATAVGSLSGEISAVSAEFHTELANAKAASEALAAADLNTAEGVAQADAAAAQLAASQEAAAALSTRAAALQGQLDDQTRQLEQLEATQTITLPGLNDVTIPNTISVPVAVGALGVAVAGIISEIDTCMVSVCSGPHNWQSLLNTLTTGATLAELIAFMQGAISDPAGEAAAVASLGSGLYSTGHALIDDLLSL